MTMELRPVQEEDMEACGKVMYAAFTEIAQRHNFPPDFPSPAAAEGLLNDLAKAPAFDAFVAEQKGRILGSIFISRRSRVGGISVLTIDPKVQDRGIGRRLLQHGMRFLVERGHARQQIVQAGYHNRSLCLYAKSGFIVSELLSNMTGNPIRADIPSHRVRKASAEDASACNALCRKVHGFDREHEVAHAIVRGRAVVVESRWPSWIRTLRVRQTASFGPPSCHERSTAVRIFAGRQTDHGTEVGRYGSDTGVQGRNNRNSSRKGAL